MDRRQDDGRANETALPSLRSRGSQGRRCRLDRGRADPGREAVRRAEMARDDNERMMAGLFPNRASAEQGYSSLMSCGYRADDVSVLMMDETRKRQFPADAPKTELGTKATEGAGLGAVTGGTLGALLLGLSAGGLSIARLCVTAT